MFPIATLNGQIGASLAPLTDGFSDLAVHGPQARAAFNVSGAGIRVGILSDSFNRLGGMAADVAHGDLRGGTTIVKEGPVGSSDEGRAMAELIHRIAPGAQIFFYSAFNSESDFAHGITTLQSQYHCQVIVDDVTYFDEPFYQTGGLVQAAVQKAVAAGASYFTAASNEGKNFYEHSFQPMSAALPAVGHVQTLQNFGSVSQPNDLQAVTVQAHSSATLDLQWAQPFASIGGKGSADTLGVYAYNAGNALVGAATQNTVGGNPVQMLTLTDNSSVAQTYRVAIADLAGPAPSQFKYIIYGNATINDPNAGVGSGTVIGHEMVTGANTVGAVPYFATPAFGSKTPGIESFSSVGPGELLYDSHGNPLSTPTFLNKVDFLAPDGSSTSVFQPFYGTSAAAPDAAAIASLMLQANHALTPAQITEMLKQSAIPAAGGAVGSGAGLVQADVAVRLALAARAASHAIHDLVRTAANGGVAHADRSASHGQHGGSATSLTVAAWLPHHAEFAVSTSSQHAGTFG